VKVEERGDVEEHRERAAIWRHTIHSSLFSFGMQLKEVLVSQKQGAQPFYLFDPHVRGDISKSTLVSVSDSSTLSYLARQGANMNLLQEHREQLLPLIVSGAASLAGIKLPFNRVERKFALLDDQQCFCVGRLHTSAPNVHRLQMPSQW
jgi:hypothetical protein